MDRLDILCFGDSLTEGYSDGGLTWCPYAESMSNFLKATWPSKIVAIEVKGRSGDFVISPHGKFMQRIQRECSKSTKFDWVIILGGTNDLAYGSTAALIFNQLKNIYDVALNQGSHVLALTVPECQYDQDDISQRRYALNDMILEYKADRFHTLPFHSLMPYHSLSSTERVDIWDDGLHMTPYGYGVMGELIANRLAELISEGKE